MRSRKALPAVQPARGRTSCARTHDTRRARPCPPPTQCSAQATSSGSPRLPTPASGQVFEPLKSQAQEPDASPRPSPLPYQAGRRPRAAHRPVHPPHPVQGAQAGRERRADPPQRGEPGQGPEADERGDQATLPGAGPHPPASRARRPVRGRLRASIARQKPH